MAMAMANSHMRMRVQVPMLTMSDTAPMAQKEERAATAPNTNARANAAHATSLASAECSTFRSETRPCPWPGLFHTREALFRSFCGGGGRVAGQQAVQRTPGRLGIAHFQLAAREVEQG